MLAPKSQELTSDPYIDFDSVVMADIANGLLRDPTTFDSPEVGRLILGMAGIAPIGFRVVGVTRPSYDVENIAWDFAVGMALARAEGKAQIIREPENFRSYTITAARNHGVSFLRKRGSHELPGFEPIEDGAKAIDTDRSFEIVEASTDVEGALRQINPDRAKVIRLIRLEGFSYADAAELLGIPINTVRSQYSRGMATLKGLFI